MSAYNILPKDILNIVYDYHDFYEMERKDLNKELNIIFRTLRDLVSEDMLVSISLIHYLIFHTFNMGKFYIRPCWHRGSVCNPLLKYSV